MTVAVALSSVAVVVRQLIRGNAIAHAVFVPWCDRKPRNGRPRGCVLTDVTKARPATAQRQTLEELQLPSIFVMDVLKNCGFGAP